MKGGGIMRIGILETGEVNPALRPVHGTYPEMFARLLDGHGFEFRTWSVLNGELPRAVDEADGWLITGSRFGAYEDHAWIAPLEGFIREVAAARRPMAGICFGHQIMAQALGGAVARSDKGWGIGRQVYRLPSRSGDDTARGGGGDGEFGVLHLRRAVLRRLGGELAGPS
jgi:GMP synthase (glutamine-hydrolysing)